MIQAYIGTAPTLTYFPMLKFQGKAMGTIQKYVAALGELSGFTFDASFVSGFTVAGSKFKYQDFGGLQLDRKVEGGNNGQVNCEALAAAFLGVGGVFTKAPFVKESAHPFLFGVVDHNSAHHFSWPLVVRALRNRATKSKKVVFNFDAHYDYGTAGNESIYCSTWGVKLFEAAGQYSPANVADAYAAIGLHGTKASKSGDFSTAVFTAKSQDKAQRHVTQGTDTTSGTKMEALLDEIEKKAGVHGSAYSAYVTVDRDFTQYSFTPYKDGDHDPAHGRAAVTNLLALLKKRNCELIGFDVCGLPNSDGGTTVSGKKLDDGLQASVDDLKAFHAACSAF